MDVGGALTVWLIPLVCVLGIIGIEWKWKFPHFHIADFFKADQFNQGIAILCIAIALVPLGWWIALPAGAIGMGIRAIASEDSRKMWPTRWQARSAIVVAIVMGSVLAQKGQRFITTSVDGKTVYVWFREEDQQWYDRDKVHFLSEEHVEE